MVVVFMYFFVFKETSQCGTLNNGCQHNAPMARAPVIRATIWPQIRRIVSPRIVICQSHHIVHQVSKHKTEIVNNANKQTKTTLQRTSNLRVTLIRSMRRMMISEPAN